MQLDPLPDYGTEQLHVQLCWLKISVVCDKISCPSHNHCDSFESIPPNLFSMVNGLLMMMTCTITIRTKISKKLNQKLQLLTKLYNSPWLPLEPPPPTLSRRLRKLASLLLRWLFLGFVFFALPLSIVRSVLPSSTVSSVSIPFLFSSSIF